MTQSTGTQRCATLQGQWVLCPACASPHRIAIVPMIVASLVAGSCQDMKGSRCTMHKKHITVTHHFTNFTFMPSATGTGISAFHIARGMGPTHGNKSPSGVASLSTIKYCSGRADCWGRSRIRRLHTLHSEATSFLTRTRNVVGCKKNMWGSARMSSGYPAGGQQNPGYRDH